MTKQITAVTNDEGTRQISNGQSVSVEHGDRVTYNVTVTNTSNQALYALRLDDVMDPGLTLIDGTASTTVSGNDNNTTVYYLDPTVTEEPAETTEGQTAYYWELPGMFKEGAAVTLTYQALVNMDAEHLFKDEDENVRLNNTVFASAFKTPQSTGNSGTTLSLEELSYSIVSFTRGDVGGSASAGVGSAGASAGGKMTYPVEYSWGQINDTQVTETNVDLPATVRYQKGLPVTVDTTANAATVTIGEDENQTTYKFNGWVPSDGTTVEGGKFTMPGQKVILTARWAEDTGNPDTEKWTVTYKTKTGETGTVIGAPDKVKKGQSTTIKNGPTAPDGKEFVGWSEDPDAENPVIVKPNVPFTPTKDTTFYPVWRDEVKYTVKWLDKEGGSVVKTTPDVKLKDGSLPDDLQYPTNPTEKGAWGSPVIDEGTKTITITWVPDTTPDPVPKTIIVTWYDENRTNVLGTANWTNPESTAEPQYPNAIPTKPEDASYTYSFAGWTDRQVDGSGNVSYRALFNRTPKAPAPVYFTVTWIDELAPATPIKTQSVTSLSSAVYPSHPFHEGYEGNGWSEPVRGADGNYTIYARYVPLHVDPEVPSYEYLRDVLGITVEVVCDTHATHEPMFYEVPLKANSYNGAAIGDRCVITIAPDAYVAEYVGEHSTVNVPAQQIILEYVAGTNPVSGAMTEGAEVPEEVEVPAVDESVIVEGPAADVQAAAAGSEDEPSIEDAPAVEEAEASIVSNAAAVLGHWVIAPESANKIVFHVSCEAEVPQTHTVTWLDWNGDQLYQAAVTDGEAEPPYGGAAPARPSDDTYT